MKMYPGIICGSENGVFYALFSWGAGDARASCVVSWTLPLSWTPALKMEIKENLKCSELSSCPVCGHAVPPPKGPFSAG